MKKEISKRLNKIAAKLPIVFNIEQDHVVMSAEDLKLTPVADIIHLENGKFYQIPIPKYVAVFHEQQLKDAYKRGGANEVDKYVVDVLSNPKYFRPENMPQ